MKNFYKIILLIFLASSCSKKDEMQNCIKSEIKNYYEMQNKVNKARNEIAKEEYEKQKPGFVQEFLERINPVRILRTTYYQLANDIKYIKKDLSGELEKERKEEYEKQEKRRREINDMAIKKCQEKNL